jgi:hypothetical protein
MKIRWSTGRVRLRITPTELSCLSHGGQITESLFVGGWQTVLCSHPQGSEAESRLWMDGSTLQITLATSDLQDLLEPDCEGVYFPSGMGEVAFQIEKDFPCLHPRPAEAAEPTTETFIAPVGFAERKVC